MSTTTETTPEIVVDAAPAVEEVPPTETAPVEGGAPTKTKRGKRSFADRVAEIVKILEEDLQTATADSAAKSKIKRIEKTLTLVRGLVAVEKKVKLTRTPNAYNNFVKEQMAKISADPAHVGTQNNAKMILCGALWREKKAADAAAAAAAATPSA